MTLQKYDADGFYMYNCRQGLLTGTLEYNLETGRIEGEIHDAGSSRSPNQEISGLVELTNKSAHLFFTKYPKDAGLANLIYRLKKNLPGVEGRYVGTWSASPEKIITENIGNDERILAVFRDNSVQGIGDYAELSLRPW